MNFWDYFLILKKKNKRNFQVNETSPLQEQILEDLHCLGNWYWLKVKINTEDATRQIKKIGGSIDRLGYSRFDLKYPFYNSKILMPYRPFVLAYDEVINEFCSKKGKREKLTRHNLNLIYPIKNAEGNAYEILQKDFFFEKEDGFYIWRICLILKRFNAYNRLVVEPYADSEKKKALKLVDIVKKEMGAKVHSTIPLEGELFWRILELSAEGKSRKDIQKEMDLPTVWVFDEHKKKCLKLLDQHFQTKFGKIKVASRFLKEHSVV